MLIPAVVAIASDLHSQLLVAPISGLLCNNFMLLSVSAVGPATHFPSCCADLYLCRHLFVSEPEVGPEPVTSCEPWPNGDKLLLSVQLLLVIRLWADSQLPTQSSVPQTLVHLGCLKVYGHYTLLRVQHRGFIYQRPKIVFFFCFSTDTCDLWMHSRAPSL